MITRTFSCFLIATFLLTCLPQKADAVGPAIARGLHELGRWISSPSGQRKLRDIVQKPGTDEKVRKAWDWVKDTAKNIKEDIEDGINDLRDVNPFCTICSMTGRHICGGTD